MFKRIDHVEIITPDMEKTIDFYIRILGFKLKHRQQGKPESPYKEIVFLSLGDTMLEIIEMWKQVPQKSESETQGYRMMAIEVENMDAAIEYLKKHGVDISRPPMVLGNNSKRAEIKDCTGFSIELRQW